MVQQRLLGHPVKVPRHHRQAELTPEKGFVALDKTPEQAVPDLTPFTISVVRHLADVVRAGHIRLGGEDAAIGELTHAVDVGTIAQS